MSLEDQYDAWVRGLMGGGKYAATPKQAEDANDAVQQMQAQLDALTEAQKRQTAAGSALNAVQKAGAATAEGVRRMSSELTKSLKQDGLLGGTVAAPLPGPGCARQGRILPGDRKDQGPGAGAGCPFVSALVKAFRRPFVLGTADDTARPQRDAALRPQRHGAATMRCNAWVDDWPPAIVLHSAAVRRWIWRSTPAPRRKKLFLQDLYAALQSDAEVLTFEHYESCAANYLNMLATLAMDGTLALSSRYVFAARHPRGCWHGAGPGAIGELQAGGKYFCVLLQQGRDRAGRPLWGKVCGRRCGRHLPHRGVHPQARWPPWPRGAELSGPAHPQAVRAGADHGRRCARPAGVAVR